MLNYQWLNIKKVFLAHVTDAIKVAFNMPANLENSAMVTGLEKVSFHFNTKECSNYSTIMLISHVSKVMTKILQARLQQYVNRELSDVQAGFRKSRGTRDKIDNI